MAIPVYSRPRQPNTGLAPTREVQDRERIIDAASLLRSGDATASSMRPAAVAPHDQALVKGYFASRPVNCVDFYQVGGTITISPDQLTETGTFSYTVPQGRRAILRQLSFAFEPVYPAITIASTTGTITVDGRTVPFNDSFNSLQTLTNAEQFLLIEEGSVFSITVVRVSTITIAARILASGIAYVPVFSASIYGNMLLRKGAPLPYEVAGA